MAYLPLSTANLPDPAIDPAQGSSPADYFDVFTWTGTGNTGRSFTDLSFQPDLVWAKDRTNAYGHVLFDSVRGAGADKELGSQVTGAEGYASTSTYDYLSSFDSNGFTSTYSGSNFAAYFNNSGDSYVAWNWKANGSGVSNTDGLTPSTVSANTESGFSIVSYTGSTNESVGHGLDQAPECIVVKNRDASSAWAVYHQGVQDVTANGFLELNQPYAVQTGSNPRFLSGTAGTSQPTSTVFYVNNYSGSSTNNTGNDYIAYCFHSVEGYSKMGSYTGNGNADGTFVYTGFRVGWLMIKRTDSAAGWYIVDNTRSIENPVEDYVQANASNAEATATFRDHLSNGFKIRNTFTNENASGGTYIYMAFAENPFKFSLAR